MPDVAAGLSLGEYCALAAAGVMTAEDAIRTVRRQGHPHAGGRSCRDRGNERRPGDERRGDRPGCGSPIDGVQVANYNCPGQIVISGRLGGGGTGRGSEVKGGRRQNE